MSATFAADLAQLARRLRVSVLGLSDSDQHLLKDVAEDRYPMKTLVRLMAIAARSVRADDREALPELVRRECLVGVPLSMDVDLAGDLEAQFQGEADVALRLFERRPTATTRAVAIEKHTAHMHGIRTLLDAMHTCRIR